MESEGQQSAITEQRKAQRAPAAAGSTASGLDDLFNRLRSSPAGLTAAAAARRVKEAGPNDPAATKQGGPLAEFLRFCASPLVIILFVASVTAALFGQVIDASIIAVMVLLSVILNFMQAYRSEREVERLRERVAPTATVLRDAAWSEIPRRDLVPGDILRLCAGDLVPADARLIQSRDLHVQEAALTGESTPAEKSAPEQKSEEPSALAANMVFLGTSVVSGTAMALVVATGKATAFGDIVLRLALRRPETEFDRGIRQFGILILETVTFLVLFIMLVNIAMHRDALESLLFAVALAVGLTPEFLPMITTVTLASGAVRMARQKVIVKHLVSIQNFGSIDVLCSDKTGTLTAAAMTFDQALDWAGQPSQRPLSLAYLNSSFETGIKSPLDAAILTLPREDAAGWEKTDEIPFDFERRRLSIVVEGHDQRMFITKGAPESILGCCTRYEAAGVQTPLGETEKKRCHDIYQGLSADGFRVLAVAWRPVASPEGFTAADERDLILAGFLTFIDPPLEGVERSLDALRRDGVRVKILTGDNELVTRHICGQVGIDATRIVLGDEIQVMGDTALAQVAEQADVFARVSPGQKNRIIRALKHRSHVVGFLGDGINDAPSLHAADVGISVCGRGRRRPGRRGYHPPRTRSCASCITG